MELEQVRSLRWSEEPENPDRYREAPQLGVVTQQVECQIEDLVVVGSIPTGTTKGSFLRCTPYNKKPPHRVVAQSGQRTRFGSEGSQVRILLTRREVVSFVNFWIPVGTVGRQKLTLREII